MWLPWMGRVSPGSGWKGKRMFMQGRHPKHIAVKSPLPILKCMPVLHSLLRLVFMAHRNLEDGWRHVVSSHTPLWPHLLPFSPLLSTPVALASFLVLEYAKHTVASGPLHLLFPLSGIVFAQNFCNFHSLTSFGSLLKCHLCHCLRELSPNTILCNVASCYLSLHLPLYLCS